MTRRVYHLHIPKTAGTSLREVFLQMAPRDRCYAHLSSDVLLAEPRDVLARADVLTGHYGLAPWHLLDPRPFTVTVLREPAARTWSHIRFNRRDPLSSIHGTRRSIDEYLQDPRLTGLTTNFQSRWLWRAPELSDARYVPADASPAAHDGWLVHWGFSQAPLPDDAALEQLAGTHLAMCDVVGPAERIADVVDVMARRLRLPLSAARHLNVTPDDEPLSPTDARALEARNRIDRVLYDAAERRLDADLRDAPPLDLPIGTLPMRASPEGPWFASGFDEPRMHDGAWVAPLRPNASCDVRFAGRAGGDAMVVVSLVGATAAAIAATSMLVQGRPVQVHSRHDSGRDILFAEVALDVNAIVVVSLRCDRDHPLPVMIEVAIERAGSPRARELFAERHA